MALNIYCVTAVVLSPQLAKTVAVEGQSRYLASRQGRGAALSATPRRQCDGAGARPRPCRVSTQGGTTARAGTPEGP
jgi:hypothetical protein